MKNFRTAIILASVLAVLSGVAYWDEWKTKKEEAADKVKDKLVSFVEGSVKEIDYQDAETGLIKLRKDGDNWQIVEPVQAKADRTAVDGVLRSIREYKYERSVGDSSGQWSKFGLDKPSRSITLRFSEKADDFTRIFLGAKAPVGYSVYVRTNKSDVSYIGSQYLLTATAKKLTDFRDKKVFEIDESKLSTLSYRLKGREPIEIKKSPNGFEIVKPGKYSADTDEINDFISTLNGERVVEFVDSPDGKLKTAFSDKGYHVRVAWSDEGKKEVVALFALHEDKLWLSYDPDKLAYQMSDSLKDKIRMHVRDFRDRSIADFDAENVAKLEVDGTVYRNVEGKWYLAADADKLEADKKAEVTARQHISDFVGDIEFSKASDFRTVDSAVKLLTSPPSNKVTFFLKDKKQLVLEAWNDSGDFVLRSSNRQDLLVTKSNLFKNSVEKKLAKSVN